LLLPSITAKRNTRPCLGTSPSRKKPLQSRTGTNSESPSLIAIRRPGEQPVCDGDGPGLRGILPPAAQAGARDGQQPSDPAAGLLAPPCRLGRWPQGSKGVEGGKGEGGGRCYTGPERGPSAFPVTSRSNAVPERIPQNADCKMGQPVVHIHTYSYSSLASRQSPHGRPAPGEAVRAGRARLPPLPSFPTQHVPRRYKSTCGDAAIAKTCGGKHFGGRRKPKPPGNVKTPLHVALARSHFGRKEDGRKENCPTSSFLPFSFLRALSPPGDLGQQRAHKGTGPPHPIPLPAVEGTRRRKLENRDAADQQLATGGGTLIATNNH
jgi:hypothetical protein